MTSACTHCGALTTSSVRLCTSCRLALLHAPQKKIRHRGTGTVPIPTGTRAATASPSRDTASHRAAVDALPPGCALLAAERGPATDSYFLLDADLITVGRHPDSDILLNDVTVSRRHAEFRRSGEVFTVSDLDSLNGTYVNRNRAEKTILTSGNEVRIGRFVLVFLAPAEVITHAEHPAG